MPLPRSLKIKNNRIFFYIYTIPPGLDIYHLVNFCKHIIPVGLKGDKQ